ncbi:diguanylate cyclase (GGDEF) domain-containing protein [Fibrobacter sp. UWEL]|nr:diguanylate cyclase (GGDEF) domain-containing protein [Fibrobacter sp. UWEL]
MNVLIVLRPEIFSITIMVFLIVYDRYCSQFRKGKDFFFKFALASLAHCVFALVTEITVNMEWIPKIVNDVCHLMLFFFALLFSIFYFEYALSLVYLRGRIPKNVKAIYYSVAAVVFVATILSPLEYIQGSYTRYSHGVGPFLTFGLAFLFLIVADIVIILNKKWVRESTTKVLVPLSIVSMCLMALQILVPEFFFTAPAMTLIAAAIFFAIENPVGKFKEKAFIDQKAKIWNRNCYEYDVENRVSDRMKKGDSLIYVMGDVNGLKTVNDNLGHADGDLLIKRIASNLQQNLKSAYRVYRVGGDEFVALYFDTPLETVREEVDGAVGCCREIEMGSNIPVGISVGYAEGMTGESIRNVAKRAEKMMYEAKCNYYRESGFDRRKV